MMATTSHVLLALALAAFGQTTAPSPGGDPTLPASIHPIKEFDIPICAEVDGKLTRVAVRQGDRVAAGELLATIDERYAQAAVEVAQLTYESALARADDDIEERYARKAAEVARADYRSDLDANQRNPGVVSPIQIQKKLLDWQRATLQIEKAMKDQVLSGKEAAVKAAELRASQIALDRRRIVAPWDGEVLQVVRHQSEWVNPGDPVLHLLRFDVLQVESLVESSKFDPADLYGRPVTVHVTLARNRLATVEGTIVHVDLSAVEGIGYGQFKVRAEIQNQREGEFWLVRPGLPAEMTIHISRPAVDPAPRSARVQP